MHHEFIENQLCFRSPTTSANHAYVRSLIEAGIGYEHSRPRDFLKTIEVTGNRQSRIFLIPAQRIPNGHYDVFTNIGTINPRKRGFAFDSFEFGEIVKVLIVM